MTQPSYNRKPYYDDFDTSKNFYRCLFRPGVAVQARELTQLQTMLQDQIAQGAEFFVKDGDQVAGGKVTFSVDVNYIKISDNQFPTTLDGGIATFIDYLLIGETTGALAKVVHAEEVQGVSPKTMWVEYQTTAQNAVLNITPSYGSFNSGETVTSSSGATGEVVSYDGLYMVLKRTGDTSQIGISVGDTLSGPSGAGTITTYTDYSLTQPTFIPTEKVRAVSDTVSISAYIASGNDAVGKGSLAYVDNGIYYFDGLFVRVYPQTIALDAYGTTPSYRIGLTASYDVVTSDSDESLLDNSAGTVNYKGRGADRARCQLFLSKRALTSTTSSDTFIELLRVEDGLLQSSSQSFSTPVLENTLAHRTYDESGSYTVVPFDVDVTEHSNTLSDALGRDGKYTTNGDTTKLALEISSGKAYVEGFETVIESSRWVDVDKARDFQTETSPTASRVDVSMGNYVFAHGVYQIPQIRTENASIDAFPVVTLYNGDYVAVDDPECVVEEVSLGSGVPYVIISNQIRGYTPGAFAYGKLIGKTGAGKGRVITIINSSTTGTNNKVVIFFAFGDVAVGDFTVGDRVNLVSSDPTQVHSSLTQYTGSAIGTARVKDVQLDRGNHGLNGIYRVYLFDIQMDSGYTFNDVKSAKMKGSLTGQPSDFSFNVLSKYVLDGFSGVNFKEQNYLNMEAEGKYGVLKTIKKQGGSDILYAQCVDWNPVTREMLAKDVVGRWVKSNSFDSSINEGDQITEHLSFNGWNVSGASGVVRSKTKLLGGVQNRMLWKLPRENVKNVTEPVISEVKKTFVAPVNGDVAFFTIMNNYESFLNPKVNEEKFIISLMSSTRGNVGIVEMDTDVTLTRVDNTHLKLTLNGFEAEYAVLNTSVRQDQSNLKTKVLRTATETFTDADVVNNKRILLSYADIFDITSIEMAQNSELGDPWTATETISVADLYKLDNGQRDTYYARGAIEVKAGKRFPERPIRITYRYFEHRPGQFFTVKSYKDIDYEDIPTYVSPTTGESWRLADCYDLRPCQGANGTFIPSISTSFAAIPSPDSVITASSVESYQNRIDKVYLSPEGNFHVLKGSPDLNPQQRDDPQSGMPICLVYLKAYTYDTNDVTIQMIDNKRYTMRDIGRLETRINRLEAKSQLSNLEKDTADLLITDDQGTTKYKSGFVVDSFEGHSVGDVQDEDYSCAMDMERGEVRPSFIERAVELDLDVDETLGVDGSDYFRKGNIVVGPIPANPALRTTPFASQTKASKKTAINLFGSGVTNGIIKLSPRSDFWRSVNINPDVLNNSNRKLDAMIFGQGPDKTFGSIWNEWQRYWFGVQDTTQQRKRSGYETRSSDMSRFISSYIELGKSMPGLSASQNDPSQVAEDRRLFKDFVAFMRDRVIAFSGYGFRPHTKLVATFDGKSVNLMIQPTGQVLGGNLITDANGSCSGVFYLPESLKVKTGPRVFRLENENASHWLVTWAQAFYTAAGQISFLQPDKSVVSTQLAEQGFDTPALSLEGNFTKPIAQTFFVGNADGLVMSSVDLYFADDLYDWAETRPVIVDVRTVSNGTPTYNIVPYSQVVKNAAEINRDATGATPTTFTFDSPVYLRGNTEYAITIRSDSQTYQLWSAKIGQTDITTNELISKQPFSGEFFNSSGRVGDTQDLKFVLNRYRFMPGPTVDLVFTNVDHGTEQLSIQPFYTVSGSARVRVTHPNHGLLANISRITIAGVTEDQNGISATNLNGTFIVNDCDVDHYTILATNGDTADKTGLGPVTSSTGTKATVSYNVKVDTIYPAISQMVLPGTQVSWGIRAAKFETYEVPDVYTPLESNSNYSFMESRVVCSEANTDLHYRKSQKRPLYLRARISTESEWVAPMIDLERLGVICIANRINNRYAGEEEFDTEFDQVTKISASTNLDFVGDTEYTSNKIQYTHLIDLHVQDEDYPTITGSTTVSQYRTGKDISTLTPDAIGTFSSFDSNSGVLTLLASSGVFTLNYPVYVNGSTVPIAIDNIKTRGIIFVDPAIYTGPIFSSRFSIGDRIDVSTTGPTHKFVVKNALVEEVQDHGLIVSYGQTALLPPIQTATAAEAGTTTIYNRTRETNISSVDAPTTALLKAIEPNKYIEVSGSQHNDGLYRVRENRNGSVVVDGYLFNEDASGSHPITITQRENFVDDLSAKGSSTEAVYMTKQIKLSETASGLKVYLTANIPSGCSVDLYYKTVDIGSVEPLDNAEYVPFNRSETIFSSLDSGQSVENDVYKEYTYTVDGLENFTQFKIKVAMRGVNTGKQNTKSTIFPTIQDFRAIATY